MPIPAFEANGLLPVGIHTATWGEMTQTFGGTGHRRALLRQLRDALLALKKASCTDAYIDGSFVTSKAVPSDYDMCWGTAGVVWAQLDPVLYDFSNRRRAMKAKYGGDIFPADTPEGLTGKTFLNFFQEDRDGTPKGIVRISLATLT
jgi:hypothetical protein